MSKPKPGDSGVKVRGNRELPSVLCCSILQPSFFQQPLATKLLFLQPREAWATTHVTHSTRTHTNQSPHSKPQTGPNPKPHSNPKPQTSKSLTPNRRPSQMILATATLGTKTPNNEMHGTHDNFDTLITTALLRDCHPTRLPHCPIVDCQQLGSARLPCCLTSHHGEQMSSATTQTTVNRARHCGPQHACNPCTLDHQSPRTDRNWSQIRHGPDTLSPVRVELFSPTP